jgi:hypothetical protein
MTHRSRIASIAFVIVVAGVGIAHAAELFSSPLAPGDTKYLRCLVSNVAPIW